MPHAIRRVTPGALLFASALVVALLAAPATALALNKHCTDCHDNAIGVTSAKRVDFTAPSVDLSRCAACHWKAGHFEHGNDRQCNSCHYALPARTQTYSSVAPTAWGWFSSAASIAQSPEVLHSIHVNGSWPQGVKRSPSNGQLTDCISCHAPAACDACHEGVTAHGPHTKSNAAFPPRTYRMAVGKQSGAPAVDTTQFRSVTCAASACHDLAEAAASAAETRTEENGSGFVYTGTWWTTSSSYASGGAMRYASKPGSVLTISFTGPGTLRLYGRKDPYSGRVRISIDGGITQVVDLYSGSTAWRSLLFDTGPLGSAPHTLRIEPDGSKSASALGTRVQIDYALSLTPAAEAHFTPDCVGCHAPEEEPHGYNPARHPNTSPCTEGCHLGDLDATHRARGLTCSSCHSSSDNADRTAIWTADTQCESCHDGGHALDKTFCESCHGSTLRTYPGAVVANSSKHMSVATSTRALTSYPETTQTPTACTNCHDTHANDRRADGDTLCYGCHDGAGTTKPADYSYQGQTTYAASGHSVLTDGGRRVALLRSDSAGFGAWESVTEPTPSAPGTQLSSAKIAALMNQDGSRAVTSLASATGGNDYQMYRFKLPVSESALEALTLRWTGFGEDYPGYPVTMSVWNRSLGGGAGAWESLRSEDVPTQQPLEIPILADQHVDPDGYVYVLAHARNVNSSDLVSGPLVSLATNTSLKVDWTTQGYTDGWVDIGATASYGSTFGSATRTAGHAVTATGLTPGAVYHFRARSTGRDGDSWASADRTVVLRAASLVDIGGGATNGPIAVNFQWNAPGAGAYVYRLHVWSSGGLQYVSDWTAATSQMVYDLGWDSYGWQVEAKDLASGYDLVPSAIDYFGLWEYVGSCPFVFNWDGERWAFEADINTTGKLGEKTSSGYSPPDPRDRYLLTSAPVTRDGAMELRLVEERREVDYTDELKLYAVDVPEGTSVYAEKGERGGASPLPPSGLHTATALRSPTSIVRTDTGADITSLLAEDDDEFVVLNEDANDFAYKTLEMDLGDVSGSPQVKIVMNAETQRPTSPEGAALSRTFPYNTKLQVQDVSGAWRDVPASEATLPNAMEFERAFVFDVTRAMHDTTGKVRFTYLYKTFIDRIAVDTSADLPIALKEIGLSSAELGYHGLDAKSNATEVFDYVYGERGTDVPPIPGTYTRLGDVTGLLRSTDDKFVIWGPGDEMRLRFAPIAPPEDGVRREYLVFVDGYYKSVKSAVEQAVEPLPFAAMSNFPYAAGEHYPDDADHAEYRRTYNTRVVTEDPATWKHAPAGEAADDLHRSLNTDFVSFEVAYADSAIAQGGCERCHAVHGQSDAVTGAPIAGALWTTEDRLCTGDGQSGCHAGPSSVTGIDIAAAFANPDRSTHHDVNPGDQRASGSKVTCSDCHNPHKDTQASRFDDPDAIATPMEASPYLDAQGRMYVLVGAKHDGLAPVLGNISVSASEPGTPTVTWTTDEPGSTWLDWGETAAYGTTVGSDAALTSHSASFGPLTPGVTYHYRLRSTDRVGNERVTGDLLYVMTVPPEPPVLTQQPDNSFANGQGVACTLSWEPVAAPDGDPVEYEVLLDGVRSSWQSGTTFTKTVWGGYHYWTVRARDAVHTYAISGYSPTSYFTVTDNTPPASCPFLFTWDGTRWVFESDLNTTGKLGEKTATGYSKPDPRDRYTLEAEPAVKDGKLELRLVEERQEVDYTDEFKLYAVDLPAGIDVYAEKGVRGAAGPIPPAGLHTVESLRAPRTVRTDTGQDVTAKIAEDDEDFLVLNEDRERFEYKTLELDLGDVRDAPQVKIVMDAETARPVSEAGIALQRTFGATTKLEVQDVSGAWRAVPTAEATLPNAMEFARSYVFEIGRAMHDTTGKVRFTFLFKTSIDKIGVDTSADRSIEIKEVALSSATLGWHGLDGTTGDGDQYEYVYGTPAATLPFIPGLYTRYGDIAPLLRGTDDKFVIWGPGDELTMRFEPLAKPVIGRERHYIAFVDGYYKSRKSAVEQAVEPLPFAAMSNFPYAAEEHYPDDAEHVAYRAEYNTRSMGAAPPVPNAASTTPVAGAARTTAAGESSGALPAAKRAKVETSLKARLRALLRAKVASVRDAIASLLGEDSGERTLFAQAHDPLHYSLNTDRIRVRLTKYSGEVVPVPVAAGWESAGAMPTIASPGSPVEAGTLAATAASGDAAYWITDIATADQDSNWHLVRFDADSATAAAARNVTVDWRGHGEPSSGYPVSAYVWNFQTSAWEWKVGGEAGVDLTFMAASDRADNAFCLRCHDGAPPAGVTVPSRNVGATWNVAAHGGGAGTGQDYLTEGYRAGSAPVGCGTCHDSHGNGNLYHLQSTINGRTGISVTTGVETENACVACHSGNGDQWHTGCHDCHFSSDNHEPAPYIGSGADCAACHTHSGTWTHPPACHCTPWPQTYKSF